MPTTPVTNGVWVMPGRTSDNPYLITRYMLPHKESAVKSFLTTPYIDWLRN